MVDNKSHESRSLSESMSLLAMFSTDLSMAFDMVDHVKLLRKLELHGIKGRTSRSTNWLVINDQVG